MINISNAVLKF